MMNMVYSNASIWCELDPLHSIILFDKKKTLKSELDLIIL